MPSSVARPADASSAVGSTPSAPLSHSEVPPPTRPSSSVRTPCGLVLPSSLFAAQHTSAALAFLGVDQPLRQFAGMQGAGLGHALAELAVSMRRRTLIMAPGQCWKHQTPPVHVEGPLRVSLPLSRLQQKLGTALDFHFSGPAASPAGIVAVHGQRYWASLTQTGDKATEQRTGVRAERTQPSAPVSQLSPLGSQASLSQSSLLADAVSQVGRGSRKRRRYVRLPSPPLPRAGYGLVPISDDEEEDSMPAMEQRDTFVSPASVVATQHCVGAVLSATQAVLSGERVSAFALVRPPGHHAGCCSRLGGSQGFCLVNNVMVAAAAVLRASPSARVAVVDIDVHFGNGSFAMAKALNASLSPSEVADADTLSYLMRPADSDDESLPPSPKRSRRAGDGPDPSAPSLLFASVHQYLPDEYPASNISSAEDGRSRDTRVLPSAGGANVTLICKGLTPGSGSAEWRSCLQSHVLQEVESFAPNIIFVSAGFDGHRDDPVGQLDLCEADFKWVATQLASAMPVPRLVSVLEGGYGVDQSNDWALVRSIEAHVRGLLEVAAAAAAAESELAPLKQRLARELLPSLLRETWKAANKVLMPEGSVEPAALLDAAAAVAGQPLVPAATADFATARAQAAEAQVAKLKAELRNTKERMAAGGSTTNPAALELSGEKAPPARASWHTNPKLLLQQVPVLSIPAGASCLSGGVPLPEVAARETSCQPDELDSAAAKRTIAPPLPATAPATADASRTTDVATVSVDDDATIGSSSSSSSSSSDNDSDSSSSSEGDSDSGADESKDQRVDLQPEAGVQAAPTPPPEIRLTSASVLL